MNNKLTLQINSKEALERLIGGDSEIEIEVRNSVVQKFAEKHLKPLANCEPVITVLNDLKTEIKTQIAKKCASEIATFKESWSGHVSDINLRPEVKSEIDRQVRLLTDQRIQETVDEAIKFWVNETALKERINKKFEYYTSEHISSEVRNRIDKLKASM